MIETSILIGGFGGQGVLLLGRLIAYSGMLEEKEVTCFPSYGAEMRGGTANCTVIVSEELIGSPIVNEIDVLIAMNEASLKRFSKKVKDGGTIFYNTSLISETDKRKDITYIGVPAYELASVDILKSGSAGYQTVNTTQIRSTNMIMLGAFISYTGLIKPETSYEALRRLTGSRGEKRLSENIEAIKRGIDYIASKKG